MKFYSTRNHQAKKSFSEAIFQGLAPDGGLYVPEDWINLKSDFLELNHQTTINEIAELVTYSLMPEELSRKEASDIAQKAFPFAPKIDKVKDQLSILELYHGPSSAFKDFGANYLATVMEHFLKGDNRKAIILTATSGDTGSAVAQAFYEKDNIEVVILYPSGRVSPLQEKQLTTLGKNITAIEIEGSFDDCQKMVKEAFVDEELMKLLPLTSANSINLGRLIPQSFYYIWAFSQLKEQLDEEIYYCVPSGNFGNLTAGIYAWKWGLPVSGFLAATNANDVVPEYLQKGDYQPRPSIPTYSNAMDVGNPSNFERLRHVFDDNWNLMRSMIQGETISDKETLSTMKRYYEEKNRFICPHTAVGVLASENFLAEYLKGSGYVVSLATAHAGKFLEVSQKAIGREPELPETLKSLLKKEKQAYSLGNTLADLKTFLKDHFA
ncbi:threonine synthase [Spirochaeta cellobiosiphila]|uniref:threonine synthase n=1 Tax=Spirochaeta cellobiosiphila TaxID=504483 RepID=UPI0004040925|nr:threonine synthase [Spirochaeta cellobiosiphila]